LPSLSDPASVARPPPRRRPPRPRARRVSVKLKAEAADLLNKTFKIDALEEGLVIGVATITVNTA